MSKTIQPTPPLTPPLQVGRGTSRRTAARFRRCEAWNTPKQSHICHSSPLCHSGERQNPVVKKREEGLRLLATSVLILHLPPLTPPLQVGGGSIQTPNGRGENLSADSSPPSRWVSVFVMLLFIGCTVCLGEELNIDTPETTDHPVVYAIEVIGNRMTKTDFILREMSLKPGMTADPEQMEADRLRLESLGLFNRVEINVASDKGRAVVIVTVTEPLYIYLFPILRYDPTKPDKSIYGFGIYHRNIRGYGERLGALGWTGYQKGLFLTHEDPWFRFGGKIGLDGQWYWTEQEILNDDGTAYLTQTHSVEITARYRFTHTFRIELKTAWEQRTAETDFYTLDPDNRDRLLVGQIELRNDLRDYRYYPTTGSYFRAFFEGNCLLNNHCTFFYRERIELRKYLSCGRIIFAGRLFSIFSQHQMPYYRHLTLSKQLIRADYDFGNLGTQIVAANLEIRFNILKLRYFSLDRMPWVGRYLRNLRFSMEGVTFVDRGCLQHNETVDIPVHRKYTVKRDFCAYGCGLQFQVPYIQTMYILMGWNPDDPLDTPQLVIRNGVTF
ncbi:MAG: POTRA domain-containing protein [Candidatus Electryoneaceae bacterium]|nr:POTRA domain-containing protein [Candidatus Electryoneaceae bacterium]